MITILYDIVIVKHSVTNWRGLGLFSPAHPAPAEQVEGGELQRGGRVVSLRQLQSSAVEYYRCLSLYTVYLKCEVAAQQAGPAGAVQLQPALPHHAATAE